MPSQPDDNLARNRFMVINLVRIVGVAMIMLGIAVLRGLVELPEVAAYVLIMMGVGETFVVPQMLARAWSSRNQGPPQG